MPFVDVEDTNFPPYPIHLPVACGRDLARADASATQPNPAALPRPKFAGGSKIQTELTRPAPRDDRTNRNFSRFGALVRAREQPGVRITAEERYPRRKLRAARVRAIASELARRNRDPRARSLGNNGR